MTLLWFTLWKSSYSKPTLKVIKIAYLITYGVRPIYNTLQKSPKMGSCTSVNPKS